MANIKSEKKTETVIYSQFQSWSPVGVPSCMEQVADSPVSLRIEEFHKTPKSHPWRPTLGYKKVLETAPLFAQPITNLTMDAYRIPHGMTTKPLKFPNLVIGFDRSPSHAARAALCMRYTPYDWKQNQIRLYDEADTNRCFSEKLRKDSLRLVREVDDKIKKKQMENDQKLEENTTSWRNEVASELERLIIEDDKLQECRHNMQIAIQNLEGQLHIAQECLYHRESRKDADLVHDEAESVLLKEIETVRNCEKKLEQITYKCINQLQTNIWCKKTALEIDVCHQINDFSRDLQYYSKIKKYDHSITEIGSWAENIMKRLEAERVKSSQLRSDIDTVMNAVNYEVYEAWENTNKALNRRVIEILEAKEKLQTYLHKIQEEISNIKKSMKLIQKTIADKDLELKVANTRNLDTKFYHSKAKLCKNHTQFRINKKVEDINKIIYDMNLKLQECEAQHQILLCTKSNLESDLKSKTDALFIDRDKCMGLRRSYLTSIAKF